MPGSVQVDITGGWKEDAFVELLKLHLSCRYLPLPYHDKVDMPSVFVPFSSWSLESLRGELRDKWEKNNSRKKRKQQQREERGARQVEFPHGWQTGG